MSPQTLVTCFPITPPQQRQLQDALPESWELVVSDQDRIADDLFCADVFFGHAKVPVPWEAVVQQGRLSWIQSSAAGLDHCLAPAVIASEVIVSGCSGLFAKQVAEQTLALLLGLIRKTPQFFEAQRKKEYVRLPTDNLQGKRVLIVGFGGNGQQIAKCLRPFSVSIQAVDCFPEACQDLVAAGVVESVRPPADLEFQLTKAEVVVITLPLSDANEQLFGDAQFAAMPGGGYLINVGRGSVVNTLSLEQAIAAGHLAGVGIDVVDPEPLPESSRLWDLEGVMISPHVGAQSPLRVPVTIDLFLENMPRYLAGQSLINQVDKSLGFPRPEHRLDFSGSH